MHLSKLSKSFRTAESLWICHITLQSTKLLKIFVGGKKRTKGLPRFTNCRPFASAFLRADICSLPEEDCIPPPAPPKGYVPLGEPGWNQNHTRWGPYDRYKWSYGAPIYKWPYTSGTGVATLLIGVIVITITSFVTGRGPPCKCWESETRIHDFCTTKNAQILRSAWLCIIGFRNSLKDVWSMYVSTAHIHLHPVFSCNFKIPLKSVGWRRRASCLPS